MKNVLITGDSGFISSHVVRQFVNKYIDYKIINLDKLTYAGNLANLKDKENNPNFKSVKMEITNLDGVLKLMKDEQVNGIIHQAADCRVECSIKDLFTFAQTNVMGTSSPLQAAREYFNTSVMSYSKVDGGISILDNSLEINWRIPKCKILSEKDANHLFLKDFDSPFLVIYN